MKKIKYITLIAISLSALSCKKTLEVTPKEQIGKDVALTTLTGVNNLLNTVYAGLRGTGYYGQTFKIVPDIMADNIYPIPSLNSNRLITVSTNNPGAHMSLWGLYTSSINQVNQVIDATQTLAGTPAEKNRLLGQAYGLRALFYWDMVKLYGYNPLHIQKNFNLGVPLVLQPTYSLEDVSFPARNTVQEVYAQIEKDLLAAETALEGSNVAAPFYMSQVAVRSILSKVYLYWGKYPEAATYATKVISARGNTLVSGANYANMFYQDSNPEALFEIVIQSNQSNLNESLQSYYAQFPADYSKRQDQAAFDNNAEPKVGYGDFSPSPELLALYEAGDARRAAISTGRKSNTLVTYARKWVPTQGVNFLQNIPIMRISEIFLIRAEANFRGGAAIGATAQADLDRIRNRSGLASVPVSINAILKERRIELAFEGDRWFDLVRLGQDIPKTSALGNLPAIAITDFRILAPIPVGELSVNPNLVKNDGY